MNGTSGLWSVKFSGGITVVRDPHDVQHPSTPRIRSIALKRLLEKLGQQV